MSKTVTLMLDDKIYARLKSLADRDNRPLPNFIETAALRFVDSELFVDEFEMGEIESNDELNSSLLQGHRDAEAKRGRFA